VCVHEAHLGKVAKSCTAQIKGSIFLKINQNYFAHICPEYGLRVKYLTIPHDFFQLRMMFIYLIILGQLII